MSEHSIIAPSAAGIWGPPDGCTAYPTMAARYPETTPDPEAEIGTAAHEVGCKLIKAAAQGMFNTLSRGRIVGQVAENGLVFTDEMFDGAELYANDVMEVMRENGIFGGDDMRVEERVHAPRVHALSKGTPDCAIFIRRKSALYCWDFKFGYIVNEAFEHWQSINYIAGLCEAWGLDGFNAVNDCDVTVHVRIVQPRARHKAGPVREWVVKLSALRGYFNQLHNAAHAALGASPKCHSGAHCRHCVARADCGTALRGGLQLYEAATAPAPEELSPRSLGLQLQLVTRARQQLEYLEIGYSERIIAAGGVPGWDVVPAYGNETWTYPPEAVIRMGNLLGVDLKRPGAPITPNQARKKRIDPAMIAEYTEIPRKGSKIVPVDGALAKKVFAND